MRNSNLRRLRRKKIGEIRGSCYIGCMKEKTVYKDFRLYLQNEFVRRANKNPSYSLRSFARSLEVNDSTLSKLLSGKNEYHKKKVSGAFKKAQLGFLMDL